ncbi:O-antigen ligase family protein [Candidatus Uhrbacteria bacterium]|nr:O-antigen ligase family protein [Candidatus Uhrbacteria bacterium]
MFQVIIIVCALVGFAYVAWRSREQAVALIVFALPLYLMRFSIWSVPSTLLEGAILILFIVWVLKKGGVSGAVRCMQDRINGAQRAERLLYLFLFFLVLSATVNIAFSPDMRAGLGVWRAYFVEPALFFIVFLDTMRSAEQVRRAISASILSGAPIALLAVYQKLTGWNIPAPWDVERRVTSIYPYPNAVGLYCAPIIWLAIGRIRESIGEKKIFHAFGMAGTALLLVIALTFSKTEAAVVALAVSFFGVGMLWSVRARIVTLGIAAVGLLIFFFVPMVSAPLTEKMLLKDWSGQVRIATWTETVAMLKDHPFTGAGLAGYQMSLEPYHTHEYLEIFLYPHSIILNFWSETGLYGAVSIMLVFVTLFVLCAKTIRKKRHRDTMIGTTAFAIVAALVTILVHGLVDVPYFKNDLAIFFWFLAASVIALHRLSYES